MKKTILVTLSVAFISMAVSAAPVDIQATLSQPSYRKVELSYSCADWSVATFQLYTNNVAIDHRGTVRSLSGDINKLVPSGTRYFTWDAGNDMPEMILENLTCTVSLWATNDLPHFMAVGVTGINKPVCYYHNESELPEPIGNDRWRLDWMLFRKIPSGTFTMGTPAGEPGRQAGNSEYQRSVTISKPFYCAIYETTYYQRYAIKNGRPAYLSVWQRLVRPAVDISYTDIRGSSVNWPDDGHQVAPDSWLGMLRTRTDNMVEFDLPTEAQWEYACRAGTTTGWNNGTNPTGANNDPNMALLARTPFNGGMVNSDGTGDAPDDCGPEYRTAIVGTHLPNNWGLYDMHGNVEEWCLDWYQEDATDPSMGGTDPVGPSSSSVSRRVRRGGGWCNYYYNPAWCFRSGSHKENYAYDGGRSFRGFRLVAPATTAAPSDSPATASAAVSADIIPLPAVTGVKTKVISNELRVTYTALESGIATFTLSYNNAPLPLSDLAIPNLLQGTINQLVTAGTHTFDLDLSELDSSINPLNLIVDIQLWSVDTPPPYMATALITTDPPEPQLQFYPSRNDIPGSEQHSRYKTDWLLMRQIPATPGQITLGTVGVDTNDYETTKRVRLTKPFYAAVYPITQKQWFNIKGSWKNDKFPTQREMRALSDISHNDLRGGRTAIDWPATANAVASTSLLGMLRTNTGNIFDFDLPGAAQWEWACRAGTQTTWYNGAEHSEVSYSEDNPPPAYTTTDNLNNAKFDPNLTLLGRYANNGGMAWNGSNFSVDVAADAGPDQGSPIVGSYQPNPFGLYDMLGCGNEWCLDYWVNRPWLPGIEGDDPVGVAAEHATSTYGNNHYSRVFMGGSWYNFSYGGRDAAFPWNRTPSNLVSPGTASTYCGGRIFAPIRGNFTITATPVTPTAPATSLTMVDTRSHTTASSFRLSYGTIISIK